MRTSRWLAGSVLVSLGLATAFVAWKRTSKDAVDHATAARLQAEQLRSEVAALQATVTRLSARDERTLPSAAPERARPADVEAPKSTEDASDDSAEPRAELTLKDVLADIPPEREEQFMRELERKESRVRQARTLETLRSEPRDAAWTREVEALVTKAVADIDRKEFPTAQVTSIECGTTLCKIEVEQSGTEQAGFAGALHTGLRTYGVRRGGSDAAPGEKPGWTLFVARTGHKMPRVPLEEVLASDS